jgi:hypothetical protein
MRIFASLVATIYVVVVMSVYAPDDWHGILSCRSFTWLREDP